ncbi:response regulator [candidate division WOR-3 bacterium]|nr:response regulator [candidate division WOR-3 bacterium]
MSKNIYILLVDDNPDDRLLVIRELEKEFPELKVKQVTDFSVLDKSLEEGGFDCVITDNKLNWTDGIQVLQIAKKQYPDCPVIMFTGTGTEEIAVQAMKAGLDDYIIKNPRHFARLSASVRAVLDRVNQRIAMKEAETRYRNLFNRIPLGLYKSSSAGRIIDANPFIIDMIGYPNQESFISLDFSELYVNKKDREKWMELMKDEGIVRNFEAKLYRQDRTTIWTVDNSRAVYDNSGNLAYYEGSIDDITERKKAEEELKTYRHHLEAMVDERTSELKETNIQLQKEIVERNKAREMLAAEKERLSVTLRSIGDGVITTDTEGIIVLINKVAEYLTGWSQDEAVGKPLEVVFHIISEKTHKISKNPVEKVLKSGKTMGIYEHTILISKDGLEIIIEDSAAPIRDKDSKIVGVVLVFRDITEKKKMEEQLQRTQKLESLGVLAGGIAHDFNNILTAILGYASLGKMYTDPKSKVFEKLNAVERASYRARYLTQQLLTFSKGGKPIKNITSISRLIKDTVKFSLSGSNVRCEFHISKNLWTAEIDEGQITQTINNLIINAKKASSKGGIIEIWAKNVTVKPKQKSQINKGRYIKISIKDYGVGISKENLTKIFDPYFTTKKGGSGLGLTISYSVIRNHGGYIDVESELGKGTTFHIYLPASKENLIVKKEETTEPSEFIWGKILLVDDEKDILETTGELLKLLGYNVEFAEDGREAVELYKKAKKKKIPFDVVIMDLTLPGRMGGKEAIQEIIKSDPEVKAIVSSGYSNDPVMANYQNYGFSDVVVKPYKLREIKEILNKLMKKS